MHVSTRLYGEIKQTKICGQQSSGLKDTLFHPILSPLISALNY